MAEKYIRREKNIATQCIGGNITAGWIDQKQIRKNIRQK